MLDFSVFLFFYSFFPFSETVNHIISDQQDVSRWTSDYDKFDHVFKEKCFHYLKGYFLNLVRSLNFL